VHFENKKLKNKYRYFYISEFYFDIIADLSIFAEKRDVQ